jgi:hypothetical protein
VGLGRRKSKRNYPRPQAEVEDNEYKRASERNTRYEEVAGIVKSNADAETRKIGVDGTPSRTSSTNDREFGGLEEEHVASIDEVNNNDR